MQALRDRQRAESQTQENLVLYTEFGPDSAPHYEPNNGQPQQHHQHQMQQQQQQQRETVIQYGSSTGTHQSAIKVSEQGSTNWTTEKCDPMKEVEKISCETENMRISPTEPSVDVTDAPTNMDTTSATNLDASLTLPNNADQSPQLQTKASNATSVIASSNSVVSTSTTVTTTANTTPSNTNVHNNNNHTNNNQVAASPAPVTAPSNKKESSNNHHHFFPKFRSSKNDNHDKKDDEPSGKKKGLNFFRRKSSPKNDKSDTKLEKLDSHDNKHEVLTETNGKESVEK